MSADEKQTLPQTLWSMAIVCTDQGRHKRCRLSGAEKILHEDGRTSHYMSHHLRHFAAPDADAESGGAISKTSYTFICPRCRRNPIIERAKWWEAVETAQRVGVKEIDLSMLGF